MRTRPVTTLLTLALASTAYAGEADEKAAAKILDERMKTTRPEDYVILKAVEGKDIVVVAGSMDHIEQVLAAANIRHTVVQPDQVGNLDLNADQILMVNCPGNMPQAGLRRIEKFVRAGGLLYTTDWALLNVVQKIFPGTIKHNGVSTGDHVTGVHVHAKHDDLMSNMLLKAGSEPQWWLEGGSYPISILDQKKVQVLASSEQMKKAYGAAPVVVRFKWDDGEVIHVVSHFYRQIATQGPAIATKDAIDGVEGLTEKQKAEIKASAPSDAKFGDVASSYAFQQMTSNLVVGKKRANKDLDKSYGWTPKKGVTIEGRAVGRGERVKILDKKDGKVLARDDRGNEAWLEAETLEAR
jgi:hypothetical protein